MEMWKFTRTYRSFLLYNNGLGDLVDVTFPRLQILKFQIGNGYLDSIIDSLNLLQRGMTIWSRFGNLKGENRKIIEKYKSLEKVWIRKVYLLMMMIFSVPKVINLKKMAQFSYVNFFLFEYLIFLVFWIT
jgi:hypothetical protein